MKQFSIPPGSKSVGKARKLLTPESIALNESEHSQQVALFAWAAIEANGRLPMLRYMFAIPNGGLRDKITAANLKAEGVRAGVYDVFLPFASPGFNGMFLEMKAKGGVVSEAQHQFSLAMTYNGYYCGVAWSFAEARQIICDYLGERNHAKQ